jgi:hypothetical protein
MRTNGSLGSEPERADIVMSGPEADPDALMAVERVVGPLTAVRWVAGVGGEGVFGCDGTWGTVALKYPAPVELTFYHTWAPLVAAHGVAMPAVLAQGQSGERPFLVLEWFPRPVDEGRDAPGRSGETLREKIRYLALLHQTDRPAVVPAAAELPARTAVVALEDVRAALALFSLPDANSLERLLRLSWPRVEGKHLLSGDPNRTNWGRRQDGTLVLFDWAEAGFGHPAYDLAILPGGLVDVPTLRGVVSAYLPTGLNSQNPEQWLAWAVTVRLATFLRFLAHWGRGELVPTARNGAKALCRSLPAWIEAVRPYAAPYGEEPLAAL